MKNQNQKKYQYYQNLFNEALLTAWIKISQIPPKHNSCCKGHNAEIQNLKASLIG